MAQTPKLRTVLMSASALTASVFVMALAGQAAAQEVVIGGAPGSDETRTVGAGQTMTVNGSLRVGRSGAGTLNVTGGGVVNSRGTNELGQRQGSTGTVTVSGAGSTLTAGQDLNVGTLGNGELTVSSGAAASALWNAYFGIYSGTTGSVTVTGTGSSLTIGGVIEVGYAGKGELTVSAGATASAGYDVFFGDQAGSTGTVTVTGDGSTLKTGQDLYVGSSGNGELTVSSGAKVSAARHASIGAQTGSTGTVTVTGAGSALTAGLGLTVGSAGNGELTVSDGAKASVGSDVNIGRNSGSTGTVTVTGGGSTLTSGRDLYVGLSGNGALTVSDGAKASAVSYVSIGALSGSTGSVTVTGDGSTLTAGRELYVGNLGNGELTVSSGAEASAVWDAYIGSRSGSTGTATVTGAGSALTAGWNLFVGDLGNGELTVSDGAEVSAGSFIVLGSGRGTAGAVAVTGAGSALTAGLGLSVGNYGNGELTVSSGAKASAGSDVNIGRQSGSTGTVTVTGDGSTLTTGQDLNVGYSGNGELTVSSGAQVSAASSVSIGVQSRSTGTATVTGAGSTLTAGRELFVGNAGNGTLTVSDGATASAGRDVAIGALAGSTGTAAVTGPGSSLTVGGQMKIGVNGHGLLNVTNGGVVRAQEDIILGEATTGRGVVNVTGAGSALRSESWIFVGRAGYGELKISDGGHASTVWEVMIGENAGSEGVVTVTGAGSALRGNRIVVGQSGRGELMVSNGAEVRFMDIAVDAGSTGLVSVGGRSGAAAQGAGILDAVRFGAGDGHLVFNHNTAGYAFSGGIGGTTAGQGRISFEAGRTQFNTTDYGFTGVSDIHSGAALILNGALMGTLNVRAGGELSGVGTVGVLNNAGTLNIGGANTLGVLNGTSASFASGSTFAVDFSGASSDRLVLTGAANIASGSILSVNRPTGVVWRAGDRSTFLSAAGGVTGTFTLQNNSPLSAFLGLRNGYTATTAYLEVAQIRDFAAASQTANQTGVASGIQSVGSASALFNAIANMPNDAAAQTAFTALSGELHPGVRSIVARDGYRLQQAVIRNGSTTGARDAGARIWGEAWTSDGEVKADGNAERLDYDTSGFIVGSDVHFAGGWRLGAALAVDEGDVDSGRSQGRADLSRRSVMAYLDGQLGSFDLKGGLGYTGLGVKTSRVAAFASPAGAFNETLRGDYDGSIVHAYVDASYPFALGEARAAPFVNLSRVAVSTDAHSETGGLAALNVKKTDADLTFSTLGLRISGVSFIGASVTGSAGWRNAAGDRDVMGLMSFNGGSEFRSRGPEISRNAAVVDLGAEWKPTSNLSVGAGVSYVGGGDESDKGARLSLRYSF